MNRFGNNFREMLRYPTNRIGAPFPPITLRGAHLDYRVCTDIRIPPTFTVPLRRIEKEQMREMCQLPGDLPRIGSGDEFDREGAIGRCLDRECLEVKWCGRVHAVSIDEPEA